MIKSRYLRDLAVHPTVSSVRPVSLGTPLHLVMLAHKVAQYGDKFLIVQLGGLTCESPLKGCPASLFHLLLTADLS